jgi:hypothetical protein
MIKSHKQIDGTERYKTQLSGSVLISVFCLPGKGWKNRRKTQKTH